MANLVSALQTRNGANHPDFFSTASLYNSSTSVKDKC